MCCFSKSGTYVRVSEMDWQRLGEDAGQWARMVGRERYMRMEEGHCLALQITTQRGEAPVFFCAVYEKRPQVCRALARGKAACLTELHSKGAKVGERYR